MDIRYARRNPTDADASSRDVPANPRLGDDDGGVDADGATTDATGEAGVDGEGVGTESELEEDGEDGGKGNPARVVAATCEELAAEFATPEGCGVDGVDAGGVWEVSELGWGEDDGERGAKVANEFVYAVEADETGGVGIKGAPDALEVVEVGWGDDGVFSKDAERDVVEYGGDEEIGEDVAHRDDVGDKVQDGAVWKAAVGCRRAVIDAKRLGNHEIVHVLPPTFSGDDLEEEQKRAGEGLKVGILVQRFAVLDICEELRSDPGVHEHPNHHQSHDA